MPHIRIPGNADNIVNFFLHVLKTFRNFRMSENQPKKQAMSAAERKRNQTIWKI